MGPQEYFVVYELISENLTVTYPNGGDHIKPVSQEVISLGMQLTPPKISFWNIQLIMAEAGTTLLPFPNNTQFVSMERP